MFSIQSSNLNAHANDNFQSLSNRSQKAMVYSTPYEGATGEVGDPDVQINPPPPNSSRITGDPFVHYILEIESGVVIIRFWFPDSCNLSMLPVDYEIVVSEIKWTYNKTLTIANKNVYRIILLVFFQEYANDFYRDKIECFSFKEIGNNNEIRAVYPLDKVTII